MKRFINPRATAKFIHANPGKLLVNRVCGDFSGLSFVRMPMQPGGVTFYNSVFSQTNLQKSDFKSTTFEQCTFDRTKMICTSIVGTIFTECHFLQIDFTRIYMRETKFIRCTFTECKMKDSEFWNERIMVFKDCMHKEIRLV